MSDQFFDPLEDIMARHENATNDPKPDTTSSAEDVDIPEDDDIYGMNDKAKQEAAEIAAEEQARKDRQEQLAKEAADRMSSLSQMPPQSLDPEFQRESIEFQTSNLEIVSRMVDEVARKHNLTSGGIPEATDADPNLRMHVMGELMEQYHLNGEIITPEFEQLVLSNWEGYVDPNLREDEPEETDAKADKPKSDEPPQINIQVEKGTPVTVNIDDSVVQQVTKNDQINIRVIEVTEQEMLTSKVVMNSQKEGIITPYVSDVYDVPLTLPLSGYRCVLKPVNYWQFIQLGSPMSGNRIDTDKKQWSIIYDHIKNVSIGDFKDFEDFLKKTKYADRELLMWGVLISASEDVETVTIRCGNPKCRTPHEIKYNPRTIIHVNDELIQQFDYNTTHTVAPGDAAIAHYNKINSTIKRYELPHTKFLVEIDTRPSAYDFINRRFPLMDQLRDRFIEQGVDEDQLDENAEYNYLLAQALFVSAISKVVDGVTYRYTNWEDIEKIITTALDMNDAAILMQLVQKLASETMSPIQFYLENVTCEKCGRHDDRIPIPDIGQTLIFQLSQRLSSTEIKLTEMEQN